MSTLALPEGRVQLANSVRGGVYGHVATALFCLGLTQSVICLYPILVLGVVLTICWVFFEICGGAQCTASSHLHKHSPCRQQPSWGPGEEAYHTIPYWDAHETTTSSRLAITPQTVRRLAHFSP